MVDPRESESSCGCLGCDCQLYHNLKADRDFARGTVLMLWIALRYVEDSDLSRQRTLDRVAGWLREWDLDPRDSAESGQHQRDHGKETP